MPVWIPFLFFLVTFGVVAAAVWLVRNHAERSGAAFADDIGAQEVYLPTTLIREEQFSSIGLWHSLLARFNFVNIMHQQLSQAGIDWSVGRLTLSMLLSGSLGFVALMRISFIPTWAAVVGTAFAVVAPYVWVLRRRGRRFDRFSAAFPDTLETLARAMRAGHSMPAAFEIAARDAEDPVAGEFRQASAEISLGMPVGRALERFAERMPLAEVDLFAAAVQLHARTGGRLTQVLETLAAGMREQEGLRGEVRALAAHGRITGLILTLVPIGIAGVMTVVNPMYLGLLFNHPLGKHLITGAVLCLVTAHLVIRKMVQVRI